MSESLPPDKATSILSPSSSMLYPLVARPKLRLMRLYIVCSLVGLGIFLSLSPFAVLRREVNDFVAFVFCVVAVFFRK